MDIELTGFETKENRDTEEDILQLAENIDVDQISEDFIEFEEKRKSLEQTRISKQTWSILEIYQKIRDRKLILNPDYQRDVIWDKKKQTAFIESLFMGIIVPPIYVVEIPGEDMLDANKYEVVDGKQRLHTIDNFIKNKLYLEPKTLEYYRDWFGNHNFAEIKEAYNELVNSMLSSVLDIYVITANSPEITKYDIFARLNKGAEKLKVNEIRKAIYHSATLTYIDQYINMNKKNDEYKEIFSANDIKRYEDYGTFYKSISYYIKTDIDAGVVKGYNSRPREMINGVLSDLQKGKTIISQEETDKIIKNTIRLTKKLKNTPGAVYLIDSFIPFAMKYQEDFYSKLTEILSDETILKSLEKSPATTKNVNMRVERIKGLLGE